MTRRHAICTVKAAGDGAGSGEFEAVLSAATLDRDGEVIDAGAFNPLPDRIPIDIDHGMSVDTTVGSGVPYYDGDVLKIRGTFSSIPRAQELRTLVVEGHIAKMSVTFMSALRETVEGAPHVRRAELLNAAFVPIPSNREASVLVAKAFAPGARTARPAISEARKAIAGALVALAQAELAELRNADLTPAAGPARQQVEAILRGLR
ncbi:hypothetical protein SAMN05660199_03958 [Klenkia soli]|uniref:Phage prohead protease, HK97 family n=1 Tax=Klenkia soli TaxID=1052260 RepID=A0A1H0SXN9_9ACTN|nr:hypothetical protein [Klenkia soli]SDP46434.1 hypothetical protein SAMN05660199_03958 [Klenkia soli]